MQAGESPKGGSGSVPAMRSETVTAQLDTIAADRLVRMFRPPVRAKAPPRYVSGRAKQSSTTADSFTQVARQAADCLVRHLLYLSFSVANGASGERE